MLSNSRELGIGGLSLYIRPYLGFITVLKLLLAAIALSSSRT
jgi:hypothetical protein